jgi:hypothetical protein
LFFALSIGATVSVFRTLRALAVLSSFCLVVVALSRWHWAADAAEVVAAENASSDIASSDQPDPHRDDPAVRHARQQLKMLDDLYKTTIVFINDTYVTDDGDVAAGEIASSIFTAMRKKGWHHARLIDATGEPINDENSPQEGFEKQATQKILAGETYVDEVIETDGRRFLLAATVVPVVNQKCLICHPGHEVGDVMGAISYRLPLDGEARPEAEPIEK